MLNINSSHPVRPQPNTSQEKGENFPLKTAKRNCLRGLFNDLGKLQNNHPIIKFLSFLAKNTPNKNVYFNEADLVLKNANNIVFYSSYKKSNNQDNKNYFKKILSKNDAVVALLGIAHIIHTTRYKNADGQELLPELNQVPFFTKFNTEYPDSFYVSGKLSFDNELIKSQKIKAVEIQEFSSYLLNLLISESYHQAEDEITNEKPSNKEKEEEKEGSSKKRASILGGGIGSLEKDEESPDNEGTVVAAPPTPHLLIDSNYRDEAIKINQASLIFLFASLGDDQNPFDFYNNLYVSDTIRDEIQRISGDLIYDLLLKYDDQDLKNPSIKLRIIQEASLKLQQDPRFAFYFQRVIDNRYINLVDAGKAPEAAQFAKKITLLRGETIKDLNNRLNIAISYPGQSAINQSLSEKVLSINLDLVPNIDYHKDFTNIFAQIIGETDSYKARLIADGIQDRIDYLIAAHYGNFIGEFDSKNNFVGFLDLGKIEILIGQEIKVDPSQKKALTEYLQKILTQYWQLRVAEHARNLGTDGVAATWQTTTKEQKQAIKSENDEDFSKKLKSIHPKGVRVVGLGKQVVAASNLSEKDIKNLKQQEEVGQETIYQFDAVEAIRKQLILETVKKLQAQNNNQVISYFVPDGAISPDANLNELEILLRNQTEVVAETHRAGQVATSSGEERDFHSPSKFPFNSYLPPGEISRDRSKQDLNQALAVAGMATSAINPAMGKIVTWLSNENNRKIAAGVGVTGVGLLLDALGSAGGVVGVVGGAAGGALIGSIFGPLGTIVGAGAGAVIGGVAGKQLTLGQFGGGTTSTGGILSGAKGLFGGKTPTISTPGAVQAPGFSSSDGLNLPSFGSQVAVSTKVGTLSATSTVPSVISYTGTQAVVATLATTGIGTLFIVNAILPAAFLVDFTGSTGSISTSTLQESKYVTIDKVATKTSVVGKCNSTKCDNPHPTSLGDPSQATQITYTIKIQPKTGYSITITDFSDTTNIAYNDEIPPLNPRVFQPEELDRRIKTLEKIRNDEIEGAEIFFDESGESITIPANQALIWQYTEVFDSRYSNSSVKNIFKMEFNYMGINGETGSDTAVTGERICFGECPAGLVCWPTTGNACQMPYGDFSHGPPNYSTYADAIDICNALGTEVRSPFDGEIYPVSCDTGYGCYIRLIPDPKYGIEPGREFLFAHFREMPISGRTTIQEGEIIGPMGDRSSKSSYANSHLHFEVTDTNGNTYSGDGSFSYLLHIMPDELSIHDKNTAIRSCYDE